MRAVFVALLLVSTACGSRKPDSPKWQKAREELKTVTDAACACNSWACLEKAGPELDAKIAEVVKATPDLPQADREMPRKVLERCKQEKASLKPN